MNLPESCPECGAGLQPERLDPTTMTVSCGECGYQHDILGELRNNRAGALVAAMIGSRLGRLQSGPRPQKPPDRSLEGVRIPWRIRVRAHGMPGRHEAGPIYAGKPQPDLHLTSWWIGTRALMIIPLVLFVPSGLSTFAMVTMMEGDPVMMTVLVVACIAVAIASWVALGSIINRTHIRIVGGQLRITHGPVPFLARRVTCAADQIRQVTINEKRRGRQRDGTPLFDLYAHLATEHAPRKLMRANNHAEAAFIEQMIEDHLSIVDEG